MQMMKKNEGITLVSLVITIIIMLMLAGIGVTTAYTSINGVRDDKLKTELGVIRQATLEQYTLAQAVNQTKTLATEPQVSFWIGEKITDKNEITFISLSEYNPQYQEEFYYRLNPENLRKIGIKDAKYTYIVNYSTGEVYNETQKTTSDHQQLYLPSTIYNNSPQKEDFKNFNDWQEY